MIYWLYEKMLRRQIQVLPRHVCFMISGADMAVAPEKIAAITGWCAELRAGAVYGAAKNPNKNSSIITGLTFHIHELTPQELKRDLPEIKKIAAHARLTLHYGDIEEVSGTGLEVTVAIGKSGREEITECIRSMAKNNIPPEQIDEKTFENYLTFKYDPDIVIKSGGDYLTDFLIWQSVYSELFFTDVNWKYFRKVDFLRILRDYQSRIRRFGT
jgi:undecaprenyl diphosphate synthase